MEKNNWCVYKHTSPSNKVYIGITSQKPEKRWKNGYGYTQNNHFWNSIQKYGWDKFEHEIIQSNISKELACQIEKELIEKYNCVAPNGYNLSSGGEIPSTGCVRTEENKKKISESMKEFRRNNPNYLDDVSDRVYSGFRNYNKEKSMAVNCYDLDGNFLNTYFSTCEANRITGAPQSHILRCCKRHNGFKSCHGYQWRFVDDCDDIGKYQKDKSFYKTRKNNVPTTKVNCYSRDEVFIKTYDSISQANIELKISNGKITEVCKGRRKTAGGYIWRYANEEGEEYGKDT